MIRWRTLAAFIQFILLIHVIQVAYRVPENASGLGGRFHATPSPRDHPSRKGSPVPESSSDPGAAVTLARLQHAHPGYRIWRETRHDYQPRWHAQAVNLTVGPLWAVVTTDSAELERELSAGGRP